MTVYSIWGQVTPPSVSYATAGASSTYGTAFTLSLAAALTGIWYYSGPSAATLPTACGVFDMATKALVAQNTSPSWSGATGSGWVKCTFPGSLTLDTRVNGYMTAVAYPTLQQAFTTGGFPVGSGIITAPATDEYGVANAPYINSPWPAFPNTDAGGPFNWFVDVEVTTAAAAVYGARRQPVRAALPQHQGQSQQIWQPGLIYVDSA